jgi:peptidoglycan/xylan/chitin deacetylase (PgdA/CDA1 family)
VSPGGVPVIAYHAVTDDAVPGFEEWKVTPAAFAAQMSHLVDNGYNAIPLEHYARWLGAPLEHPLPPKPVVLTFDDGFVNFCHALEVLDRYKLPSTMFVPTAYIGGTSTWLPELPLAETAVMSWSQISEIHDAGVEVGAHAHVHRPLDELSPEQVRDDVRRAKQILEDGLGARVKSFAYPHGYHSPVVRKEVVAAGYEYACAVRDTLSGPGDDPFAISRVFATTCSDPSTFERLLNQGNREYSARERMTTKGWRYYRRARATVFRKSAL